MASNTQLTASSSDGVIAVSREVSHDGDASQLQMVGLLSALGSESTGYTLVDMASSKGILVDIQNSSKQNVLATPSSTVDVILQANDGVDVGDVDVTSVVTGFASSNLGKKEDSAHVSGDIGVMSLGVQSSSDVAIADKDDYAPFQLDETGYLKVNIKAGSAGATEYTQDVASADPATAATLLVVRDDVLATQENADNDWTLLRTNARGALWTEIDTTNQLAVDVSSGTISLSSGIVVESGTITPSSDITIIPSSVYGVFVSSGTVSLSSGVAIESGAVSLTSVITGFASSNLGKKDDFAFASSDVGVMALGVVDQVLTGLPINDGDYAPPRINDKGAMYVQSVGGGQNGLTIFLSSDLDQTADEASTQACTLYHISAQSIDATPLYLHLYNALTGDVTVGTTVPTASYIIPSQGDGNGAGVVMDIDKGYAFGTGLTLSATTTIGGNTGPGANECVVTLGLIKST